MRFEKGSKVGQGEESKRGSLEWNEQGEGGVSGITEWVGRSSRVLVAPTHSTPKSNVPGGGPYKKKYVRGKMRIYD